MKFNKNYELFIVDDDPIYSEFITTVLNQAGFKGVSAFETEREIMDNLYQAPDVIFGLLSGKYQWFGYSKKNKSNKS